MFVGYWCPLSRRMLPSPHVQCCAGIYPNHRPMAVYSDDDTSQPNDDPASRPLRPDCPT